MIWKCHVTGLIVNNNEAIVFDTPTNDKGAEELIQWIKERSIQKLMLLFLPIFMMIV
jgi:hypothetical protein